MIKKLLLISLFFSLISNAQTYYNGATYGNSGVDIQYNGAVDSNGNLYTVGLFQSSMTLNNVTVTSNGGNSDGFLTKIDPNGNAVWVKHFGGNEDDVAIDVAIDSNDNIYLTGNFRGSGPQSFDANPATGDDDGDPSTSNADEFWLEVLSFINSRDCFIIKLDSNGDFLWAKVIGNPVGAAPEDPSTIEVDASGNVYVAGNFLYADFDPDPVTETLIQATSNSSDSFLVKLDTNGNFVWVKTLESTGPSKIEDLEISANGDFYLTGRFEGSIDLDPSGATTQTKTSIGGRDVFVLKLDSNGDYLWGNSFGSANNDGANVIRSLASGIYVGGVFSGTTEFQTGNPITPLSTDDGFLVKYDDMGNFNFVYTIGGNGSGSGLFEEVEDVTEANNTLVVSGNFITTVDFDNDPNNTANSTSNGNRDAYVLELTTSGDYISNYTIGGTDDEVFNKVHITNGNEIILFGASESASIDLDPSSGVDTYTNGFNFHDIYFSRFSTPNLLSVENAVLENFSVYPNPTTGVINIQSNTTIDNYIIYNQLGQVMKTGNETNRIDINSFPRGLYLLQLTSGNSTVTKKIVKQ